MQNGNCSTRFCLFVAAHSNYGVQCANQPAAHNTTAIRCTWQHSTTQRLNRNPPFI